MKWKGIIFDRDGTLFDSLPVILRAFNYGIEPFTEKRPTDSEWFAAFGPHEPRVMGKFIPAEDTRQAYDRFYGYYRDHFSEIVLFPGVRDLLLRVREAGSRIGLFTGGGRAGAEFCLRKEKILSLFDVLITGDAVRNPKPDPEGVLRAMEAMSVSPADTLVVGDAGADILAGRDAGATTVLARWSAGPPQDVACDPDYVFQSFSEFANFVVR